MPKIIILSKYEADSLLELLSRGMAYTDAFYHNSKRMDNIYNKIVDRIKAQDTKQKKISCQKNDLLK